MILLTELAEKLQNILNGEDLETFLYQNPTDFYYRVETAGFHIDKVSDKQRGKNFIPVFISTMGGEFDPVPELKRVVYTIPISIYFPVRFKSSMFALNEFLANVFVGTMLNYGTNSGVCLSNISVSNYGEITDLDLKQFKDWVYTTYKEEIDVMQPYMSMHFNIYLQSYDSNFIVSNIVQYQLKKGSSGTPENLVYTNGGDGISNSPISQQIVDGSLKYATNVINITNTSRSILVYPKNNTFWTTFIAAFNNRTLDYSDYRLIKTYSGLNLTYTKELKILSINENITKGSLLTYTITFGD